ncbi:MAG: hypothetical protein GY756_10000 [bacterium]|nr:hypothetical protein [bacterium]
MLERIDLQYIGTGKINFKAPGVFARGIRNGDIIKGVLMETYEKELKNDTRYIKVSEKPENKGKLQNKQEKSSKN